MPNKELMFRGRRLHYKIEGSGTPVVLIHGFAEDHSIWRYQIEALSKKHQIITPDIPGSGKSEAMEDEEINIEDFAEAIDKVIEAEKIDQFILMGHSMGGYISLAYLELFPEKIKALGLIHSTAFADSETKKQNRKKSIEFIKNNGSEPFLKTIIPDLYFDKIEENTNIETHLSVANQIKASTLIQYYNAMINRKDKSVILKNIHTPLLMIGGLHDLLIPIEQTMKEICYPNCSMISILKNSAHMGMIEEYEKTNKIISDFIQFANKL